MEQEIRFLPQAISEVRAKSSDEGKQFIEGKGIVLGQRSEYMGFYEYIEKDAVARANMDDMVAYFNHNPDFILGARYANTLDITLTDSSVDYRIVAPETQIIKDLVLAPISRGDVRGSSFTFSISSDTWEEKDGQYVRYVTGIDRVYEMGPVSQPAYSQTTTDVAKRGLDAFIKEFKENEQRQLVAWKRQNAEYRLRLRPKA